MKHEFEQKVFYSDTDAYGVVWHGSYLRWMEIGRVELCEKVGYSLTKLFEDDVTLPVAEINIRYKSPARLEEKLLIETSLIESTKISMTFGQKIYNAETKKLHIDAKVKVVATHNDGMLYRSLPQDLVDFIEKVKD